MEIGNEFIKHGPCPQCGSRDNLGVYSDHSYCFGCGYNYKADYGILTQPKKKVNKGLTPLPKDVNQNIGALGWKWLKKYGIMKDETKDMLWSDDRQWLIYTVKDVDNSVLMWQARTFKPEDRKYMTFGKPSEILHIVGVPRNETVIICEDFLSMLKIGRVCQATCAWGSHIPLGTLTRLAARFKHLGVWLDMDKAQESLKTRLRASQLGFETVRTVITEKDPKEYTTDKIKELLNST